MCTVISYSYRARKNEKKKEERYKLSSMRRIGRIVIRIHEFLRNKISDVVEIFWIVGEFCLVEERSEII